MHVRPHAQDAKPATRQKDDGRAIGLAGLWQKDLQARLGGVVTVLPAILGVYDQGLTPVLRTDGWAFIEVEPILLSQCRGST